MAAARVSELLTDAAAALGRRDWSEARSRYVQALASDETPEGLEGLAVAAWWADDVEAAIAARERAYVLRCERGEGMEAARVAGFLAWDYGAVRGSNAVASGWLQRARRLIADAPPSAEHAWLPLIEASFHLDTDPEAVLRLSTEAAEHARTHGGPDIEMTARTLQGLALVTLGRLPEGMRLLDEGTAAATAGELHDPIAIGACCCNMIIACERARDLDRAGQWCEQLAAVCARTGQRPLLALCRVHHGTVRMMRGEWADAEDDLGWAARELSTLRPPMAGHARARLAQLRLRQGRAGDARTLVARSGTHVLVSLVRAELALDDGDPVAARGHAERYLREVGGGGTIERAAALELLVDAHVRLGECTLAAHRHAELAAIAGRVATDPLRAAECCAAGRVAHARSDHDAARIAREDAIELYDRSGMPFEAACVRLDLARTLGSAGRAHALAARATFAVLGAARAVEAADRLVARLGGPRGARLTDREREILALVAGGLSNRRIAEQLVVSEHTVHRHMANIYARLGVSTRAAAVARVAERGTID